MHLLDWLLLILPSLAVVYIAYVTQRYVRGVAGFLTGGRVAGRYVVAVSGGEAAFGLISAVALFEQYYKSGYGIGFWAAISMPVALIMTLTGFLIYRYRETRVMTLAQLFELRYSKRFRIFAGSLAFLAGVLNYAIFPAVGARFFIYFTGLPNKVNFLNWTVETFPVVMAVFLGIALVIVLFGGQLTVMVSDCVQGIFGYIGYAIILFTLLAIFSFDQFRDVMLARPAGQSFVNPFNTGELQDFNLLYVMIAIFASVYNRLSWQGTQGYNAAALNAHEQKMAGVLSTWRSGFQTLMLMLLALAAYTYMHHPDFASGAADVQQELVQRIHFDSEATTATIRTQMLVPVAIRDFLPVGAVGIFLAIALFWMVSTDTAYMHSWGSILVQDVVLPLRKKPFTPEQQLLVLRLSIVGVALFAYFFSLFYGQTTYILMFFALTGAVYTGGAGSVIIGALYWPRGTTAGAWGAMLVGVAIAGVGFFFTQYWESLVYPFLSLNHPELLAAFRTNLEAFGDWLPFANWEVTPQKFPITGQEILLLTMLGSIVSYVTLSLLTCREPFNLDRMLHRGAYRRAEDDPVGSPTVEEERRRGLFQKLLGFNEHYTRGDRILAYSVFVWIGFQFSVFLIVVLWNVLFGVWSEETWFLYWKYYSVGLVIVVATITTVWFTIGGTLDLRALFKRLKTLQANAADDGRVIGHMNADDFAAGKAVKPAAEGARAETRDPG